MASQLNRATSSVAALLTFGFSFAAQAQQVAPTYPPSSGPATAQPSAYPAQPSAYPAQPAAAAPAPAGQCFPQCRAGFMCVQGQCVSACNPPCAANETCNNGQCLAVQPAPGQTFMGTTATGQPAILVAQPAPAEPVERKGVRFHDGFYLRLGLGVGALMSSTVKPSGATDSYDITGVSEQIDISLGGTPVPGFVIGGGIFGSFTPAPSYSQSVNGETASVDGGSLMAEVVGPFIDVYPNPSQGFHLMAAVGPAIISAAKGDPKYVCVSNGCGTVEMPGTAYSGTGFGLVAGVGYEAFVGDQWSIGGIARLMYTSATMSPDDSSYVKADVSAIVPGLLFGATFH